MREKGLVMERSRKANFSVCLVWIGNGIDNHVSYVLLVLKQNRIDALA